MFDFIKGTLEEVLDDSIVVDNNGIGYRIFIPSRILEDLPELKKPIKIYIHMDIKENDMSLYGFLSKDGRELFKKLISVSGVGPKVAMGILSVHSSRDVVWAIIGEDGTTLSKAPGIGKKISQRIILELKDKLVKEQEQFNLEEPIVNSISRLGNRQEAIDALVSLGYPLSQAHKAIAAIYMEELEVEILIKKALKILATY